MKLIVAALSAALGFCIVLEAQAPVTPEPLSAWPYFKEVQPHSGLSDFVLDRDVLNNARTDQADLRLYDIAGREIPYVLRVRREVNTHSLFTGHEFNRSVEGTANLVSCDLGTQPQEHNEVVIATAGNNFRRLAEVQGSSDGGQWVSLASQAILFRFTADGRSAEQNSVPYPVSRYRYLRVRVERDPQVERAAPEITSLSVRRSVRATGETVSFPGVLESREADRVQGRPASIWRIDLGGRIPIQGLVIHVTEQAFARPFQLEIVDDPAAPVFIASGELNGRDAVSFSEQFARRLKLTVTDDRNPPLSLGSVEALSAARQIHFESPTGTVRVYYGNPKAIAPHYDLAARIPADFNLLGGRLTLSPEHPNPIYHPEPKPLSERSPWIVYVVLTAACAALGAILVNLAKSSV